MDVDQVFAGLATAAETIADLNAEAYCPDAISPPAIFPAEVEITYDKTFKRGFDAFQVTLRLLVSHADDRAGQKQLKDYLAGSGALSVKQALEADQSLGGACDGLRVQAARGYGLYEHNGQQFYGAELTVYVIGKGS
jgi:hypothetical protein